jgi:hypothetical protein
LKAVKEKTGRAGAVGWGVGEGIAGEAAGARMSESRKRDVNNVGSIAA